jgi:hypothetical protein
MHLEVVGFKFEMIEPSQLNLRIVGIDAFSWVALYLENRGYV